jgi:ATP-dependent helicase/DNAse subunit B
VLAGDLSVRAADALARGEIEAERQQAVLAEATAPHAGGIDGLAADLLRERLPAEWTPSQLETYARCPFRAFTRLALRLPDEAEPDLEIDAREEGTLLHALLERYAADRVARGAWPPRGTEAELAEARALAEGVLVRFERQGRTGDPAVWAGKREAILSRLERIVRAEARDHDGLTPRLLEHAFGGDAAAPALVLSAEGDEVRLRGRIDRVDESADRLLVIDYKNARSGDAYLDLLEPEAFGVQSFQIPAYLMAAARALPGRRAEATFALLRKAERLEAVGFSPGEPPFGPSGDPPTGGEAGGEEEEGTAGAVPFATAVVRLVRRVRSGAFPIVSQGCDHCAYGAVCRFEGVAARGAEEGA